MKNTEFDSRIVIMMPPKMTFDPALPADVKYLGEDMQLVAISSESVYPGCDTRVCYSITHSNIRNVPASSIIELRITGTINQESVQDAG